MFKFMRYLYLILTLLFMTVLIKDGKSNTEYPKVFEYKSFQEFQEALKKVEPESTLKLNYSFTADGTLKENFYQVRDALYEAKKKIVLDLSDAKGITEIPINAFCRGHLDYCSELIGIILPETGVECINDGAFRECAGLKSIVIPNTVKSIGSWAFEGCNNLTSITIPASVRIIEKMAFYGCSSLVSVTIHNGIKIIPYSTFAYCRSITSLKIPDSVEIIEGSAFEECSGLQTIVIPASVEEIGDYAFSGCESLKNIAISKNLTDIGSGVFSKCNNITLIDVDKMNSAYTSIDGNLYSKDGKTLIQFACGKKGSFTIPNGVEIIAESAFYGCTSITHVRIPDSVINIADYAFYECSNLISATLSEGITSIMDYAFDSCKRLESIIIPSSVNSIGEGVFQNCNSLSVIDVSEDNKFLSSVEGNLFSKDKKILIQYAPSKRGAFTIPDGVETIGVRAFAFCEDLTSVIISKDVKNIEVEAFCGCKGLNSIIIPEGVKSIGGYAFWCCESLTSITIPASIETIGIYSFAHCNKLKYVTFKALTPPPLYWDNDAFHDNADGRIFIVPAGKGSSYRNNKNWAQYKNCIKEAGEE